MRALPAPQAAVAGQVPGTVPERAHLPKSSHAGAVRRRSIVRVHACAVRIYRVACGRRARGRALARCDGLGRRKGMRA